MVKNTTTTNKIHAKAEGLAHAQIGERIAVEEDGVELSRLVRPAGGRSQGSVKFWKP